MKWEYRNKNYEKNWWLQVGDYAAFVSDETDRYKTKGKEEKVYEVALYCTAGEIRFVGKSFNGTRFNDLKVAKQFIENELRKYLKANIDDVIKFVQGG